MTISRIVRLAGLGVACAAAALSAATPSAAGDAIHGKSVFAAQCAVCHSAARGGPAILGPNLYGVVGRKSGSVGGYAYSSAMKAAGFTWTDDRLAAYLPSPRASVPGTKMTYGGLHDPAKLADLIAYLDTLK
jgi:cytochrome c